MLVVTIEPLALFAAAIARLKDDLAAGRDPESAASEAYDICEDVRNMSSADGWKDPCNRFRQALRDLRMRLVTYEQLAEEGERMLVALPAAPLQPLDYWMQGATFVA